MIDFNKPVQTRDGRPVRILCTDKKCEKYPVLGLWLEDGYEFMAQWTASGKYHVGDLSDMDLVNVPEEQATYFAFYNDGSSAYFRSPDEMVYCLKSPDYTQTLKVVFQDGKFLKAEVFDLEAYHA